MQPAVLVRLRPRGPWRYGSGQGAQSLDNTFRSDRVYSAVTLAMQQLGELDAWLDATARAKTPAVAFSSLFPFQAETLFAPPPASLWPPPAAQLTSPSPVFLAKMRWEAVQFVPLSLVETLVTGQPMLADQWAVDGESGCLLRRDRPSQSPFRFATRARAAVDRLNGLSQKADASACVEFEAGSGLWLAIRFADKAAENAWSGRVQAALRVLTDSGFGGQRSSGWGQAAEPEWQTGTWPALLFPRLGGRRAAEDEMSSLHWLLSLYVPAQGDGVNWRSGEYRMTERNGRVESRAGSGSLKKTVAMVAEGSVLNAERDLVGAAVDVAPDGFAHPVYRAGFALALRLPVPRPPAPTDTKPVETTPTESSLEAAREEDQPVTSGLTAEAEVTEAAPEADAVAEITHEAQITGEVNTAGEAAIPEEGEPTEGSLEAAREEHEPVPGSLTAEAEVTAAAPEADTVIEIAQEAQITGEVDTAGEAAITEEGEPTEAVRQGLEPVPEVAPEPEAQAAPDEVQGEPTLLEGSAETETSEGEERGKDEL